MNKINGLPAPKFTPRLQSKLPLQLCVYLLKGLHLGGQFLPGRRVLLLPVVPLPAQVPDLLEESLQLALVEQPATSAVVLGCGQAPVHKLAINPHQNFRLIHGLGLPAQFLRGSVHVLQLSLVLLDLHDAVTILEHLQLLLIVKQAALEQLPLPSQPRQNLAAFCKKALLEPDPSYRQEYCCTISLSSPCFRPYTFTLVQLICAQICSFCTWSLPSCYASSSGSISGVTEVCAASPSQIMALSRPERLLISPSSTLILYCA